MAKPKKVMLPKDFAAVLKSGDLDAMKAVFDTCDVNARDQTFRQTALASNDCPDELTRWLVENGADLAAADRYGESPLEARSRWWQGARIKILLELGADVHHGQGERGTALHFAAAVGNVESVRLLLEYGANVDALNKDSQTPLAYALQQCSNAKISEIAAVAEVLVSAGNSRPKQTKSFLSQFFGAKPRGTMVQGPDVKAHVRRIGETFEFHRSGFNPDSVDAASEGLERLYALFNVPPVLRRVMHDGKSPIVAKTIGFQEQTEELWQLLVPSKGAADTIQGEVIRISGRIEDELERNGGVNWDGDYKKMAEAFLAHMGAGAPLEALELEETRAIITEIKARRGNPRRLRELAIIWVNRNPKPMTLPKPDYSR